MRNRQSVYTGDSRTTAWRKNTAQKKAAEGCKTLDAFISRKVCPSDSQLSANLNTYYYYDQKQQWSPSPIEEGEITVIFPTGAIARPSADLSTGAITQPSADLQAGATVRPSADLNADALVRSAVDRAVLNPGKGCEGSIQSVDLSAEDLASWAEEVVEQSARSAANITVLHPAPPSNPSVDDAIDQLTDELVAFCIGQLKKNVMSKDVDLNMNEAFEDELQVQASQ